MAHRNTAALRCCAPTVISADCTPLHLSQLSDGAADPARPLPIRRVAETTSAVAKWCTTHRGADDPGALTHFHSASLPQIPLAGYAVMLNRLVAFRDDGMEIALVLIARACQPHIEPALNLSSLSMHRLLLTALRVATKAHHGVFRSNKAFARAGGVALAELNLLERMFLDRIRHNIHVTDEELQRLGTGVRAAELSADAPVVMVKHFSLALNLWPFDEPRPRPPAMDESTNAAQRCSSFPAGGARAAVRAIAGRLPPSRITSPVCGARRGARSSLSDSSDDATTTI